MSNESKLLKVFKLILAVIFVVGILVVALYPLPDQDLSLLIRTNDGDERIHVSAEQINSNGVHTNIETQIKGEDIKEIRVYRYFDTVCIDKIKASDLEGQIAISGKVDGLELGEAITSKLVNDCHSALTERLIAAEVWLSFCMVLFIVFTVIAEAKEENNKNNHGPIYEAKRFFRDFSKYRKYVVYSAKADLRAEVANSYLNRLWWLLDPMFNMLVYVIVFSGFMGRSIENFATYIFSALLMWGYFSKTINASVKMIRSNKGIITRIYVPKFILLISNMILNFYKLLFSMTVLIVMLLIFRIHISWAILMVIPAYVLMILLSFGIGMIFMHFGVYVDDLSYAVGILLQLLMYLSGIFYDVVSGLVSPLNSMMLCLNPVAMFLDTMRDGLMYKCVSNVPLIIVWTVMAFLISCIGIHVVYRNENAYVKVV